MPLTETVRFHVKHSRKVAAMERLTASQIRTRITSDDNVYGPEGSTEEDDWGIAFARVIREFDESVLLAWAVAQDQYADDALFWPHELDDVVREAYRGQWDTPADFARHVAEGETEMGDPEEATGRAWFLENYGAFVDWEAVAQSPEVVNAYSLIRLDPENSRAVYVFEEDSLRSS